MTPVDMDIVGDPQTSGGLLMAVSADKVDALIQELQSRGALSAAVVGQCRKSEDSRIYIKRQRGNS